MDLLRHEAKYVIPASLVPEIIDYISHFCAPDKNGKGPEGEYVINTLQLDSPDLALHYAKENEAVNRFKLRVRTYGTDHKAPVFLEIKQKYKQIIIKRRMSMRADQWGEDVIVNPRLDLGFKSETQKNNYLTFVRLVKEIGAKPTVLIRYTRKSFFGKFDHYARVTFDRQLLYQPAENWDLWGKGKVWRGMDSVLAQRKDFNYSGVILELKTLNDAPQWMIDTVIKFNLERMGNCKYSTALWAESLFRGTPNSVFGMQDDMLFG